MASLTTLSPELLILIARFLGPADAACLHMELEESPKLSAEALLGVRKERRSLMERLRAEYPEEDFGLCVFCLEYKRYDDDWAQKRVSAGSPEQQIIDVCPACKNLPEFEHTRWYTRVSEGLWPNRSKHVISEDLAEGEEGNE